MKGVAMKKKTGLWIDHKKAVIVTLTDKGEEIKEIQSNVERQLRRDADSHSQSTQTPADDVRGRAFAGHLDMYYNEVVSCIRDTDSILIMGPGEAKGEFKKHLEREGLGERIVGIETVDKMTDPQIAAKVRKHFLE